MVRAIWKIIPILLSAALLLSGCGLLTLEELYCPPKRSNESDNLQAVIDKAMKNLTYCAPVSGEHQQAVQKADLDGDGIDEYLLFAQDNSETPLKILIFCQLASGYVLMDTIEGFGFNFDFVEYAQMDDRAGLEIVVGRQVSDELARSVSVYRFTSGFAKQLLSISYTRADVEDLDEDGNHELLLLNAGESERGNGMLMLYDYADGKFDRSVVANISQPVSALQRMDLSLLSDGSKGVFVTSVAEDSSLVVDTFALTAGSIKPVSLGLPIPVIRNYPVYPVDIDEDGCIEIPEMIAMPALRSNEKKEFAIGWYNLDSNGLRADKAYTYQHFADGWYLFLKGEWLGNLTVEQTEDGCVVYMRQNKEAAFEPVFTIYTLTGSDREEQAIMDGRTILYKNDNIIFAAKLEPQAKDYKITAYTLKDLFHPVRMERNFDEEEE